MRRSVRRTLAVVLDVFALAAAFFGAAFAVLGAAGFMDSLGALLAMAPIAVAISIGAFIARGVYRSVARYASVDTLLAVIQASIVGAALLAAPLFGGGFHDRVPWRILFVYAAFGLVAAGGGRLAERFRRIRSAPAGGKRVLIYGAGDAGETVVREILQNPNLDYLPVGFIDDSPGKTGTTIHTYPVLGTSDSLAAIVQARNVEEILIAVPSATGAQMREIVAVCRAVQRRSGGKLRPSLATVPGLGDFIAGRWPSSTPRAIRMEDLLRRAPRDLDPESVARFFAGRRVMVTGAGGSIGSELCLKLADAGPGRLIIVDRSEYNLWNIQNRLKDAGVSSQIVAALRDIADEARMADLIARERPEVIVHTAAYKHLPLVEDNPCEAVLNNVKGTVLIARLSARYGVGLIVNISTDKAVRPTSVLGATKRIGEMYLQAHNGRAGVTAVSVRFANVLGSSGSVIPRFEAQIKAGGPVTVTHPDATRYFMLASEAAQLVLQAAVIGGGGEIFVLEMGEPVPIADLAEQMIRLMGQEPGVDIVIEYDGLRPGEKLHEELLIGDATPAAPYDTVLIDTDRSATGWANADAAVDELVTRAENGDASGAIALLASLVPDYRPVERPQGTGDT